LKLPTFIRVCLALALAALVQACATAPRELESDPGRQQRYENRADDLATRPDWSLKGRLAIKDANDGGSGNLQWKQDSGSTRLDFHGALGRGAWRLQVDGDGAELELADGQLFRADTVQVLIRDQIGWVIPIESLAWWVRGLEAPGSAEGRRLDEDGTLQYLHQHGWEIEYGQYREVGDISLPRRLTARQEERTVKLAVRNWTVGPRHD
jgi:outer membrane lipoprotein LolB